MLVLLDGVLGPSALISLNQIIVPEATHEVSPGHRVSLKKPLKGLRQRTEKKSISPEVLPLRDY